VKRDTPEMLGEKMTELDQVQVRVRRLELANARLSVLLTLVVLVTTAIVLMGSTGPQKSVLEAQQFVLKDSAGQERGSLFATESSWGLVLYNRDSSKAAAFFVSDNGNSAMLNDRKGNSRIMAYANDKESNLAMFDVDTHQTKVEVKNNPEGAAIAFRDGNGVDRIGMGLSSAGGVVTINDANSTTRTVLDANLGLATFDPKGSFVWGAGFDRFSKEEQQAMRKVIEDSMRGAGAPKIP
jgi:hypothetical protein